MANDKDQVAPNDGNAISKYVQSFVPSSASLSSTAHSIYSSSLQASPSSLYPLHGLLLLFTDYRIAKSSIIALRLPLLFTTLVCAAWTRVFYTPTRFLVTRQLVKIRLVEWIRRGVRGRVHARVDTVLAVTAMLVQISVIFAIGMGTRVAMQGRHAGQFVLDRRRKLRKSTSNPTSSQPNPTLTTSTPKSSDQSTSTLSPNNTPPNTLQPTPSRHLFPTRLALWIFRTFVFTPIIHIPIIGAAFYAATSMQRVGDKYLNAYSFRDTSTTITTQQKRAFGLVAAVLERMPIVGPVLRIGCWLGAAMLVDDIENEHTSHDEKVAL